MPRLAVKRRSLPAIRVNSSSSSSEAEEENELDGNGADYASKMSHAVEEVAAECEHLQDDIHTIEASIEGYIAEWKSKVNELSEWDDYVASLNRRMVRSTAAVKSEDAKVFEISEKRINEIVAKAEGRQKVLHSLQEGFVDAKDEMTQMLATAREIKKKRANLELKAKKSFKTRRRLSKMAIAATICCFLALLAWWTFRNFRVALPSLDTSSLV